MIDVNVFRRIRQSTCGVITSRVQLWNRDPNIPKFAGVDFEIVGTGFVVHEDLVITNRHVIDALMNVPSDNVALVFSNYDHATQNLSLTFRKTNRKLVVSNSPTWEGAKYMDTDIALYELVFPEADQELFSMQHPKLSFGKRSDIQIGIDIGLCGFAYGNELLQIAQDPSTDRYSPVLHQGYISGMSPFDNIEKSPMRLFLTNITHAGGFSGSPIFLPNGNVIGIHCAGKSESVLTTTADGKLLKRRVPLGIGFALPITDEKITQLISYWNTTGKHITSFTKRSATPPPN